MDKTAQRLYSIHGSISAPLFSPTAASVPEQSAMMARSIHFFRPKATVTSHCLMAPALALLDKSTVRQEPVGHQTIRLRQTEAAAHLAMAPYSQVMVLFLTPPQ